MSRWETNHLISADFMTKRSLSWPDWVLLFLILLSVLCSSMMHIPAPSEQPGCLENVTSGIIVVGLYVRWPPHPESEKRKDLRMLKWAAACCYVHSLNNNLSTEDRELESEFFFFGGGRGVLLVDSWFFCSKANWRSKTHDSVSKMCKQKQNESVLNQIKFSFCSFSQKYIIFLPP